MKPVRNIILYDQFWKYPYKFQCQFNSSINNFKDEVEVYKIGRSLDVPVDMLPWSLHQLELPYKILNFLNEIQAKPEDHFIYMDVHCSFDKDFHWDENSFTDQEVTLIQSDGDNKWYKGFVIAGTVKNVTSLYKNLKGRIDHKRSFEEYWLENLINKGVPNTIHIKPISEATSLKIIDKISEDDDKSGFLFDYINEDH